EAELDTRWDVGRSPILKLKDALIRRAFGPMSEKDMVHMLVATLEKRLSVQVDDATIKISLDWHDPETAYRVVPCAEQKFLKDRSAAGTAAITDTITILTEEEARRREVVAAALAEAQKLQLAAALPVRQEPSTSNEHIDKHELADNAEKRRAIQAAE